MEHKVSLLDVMETGNVANESLSSTRSEAQAAKYAAAGHGATFASLFCCASALAFALVAHLLVPALFPSVPTVPVLLCVWLCACTPPSSGAVGATLACAVLGVMAEGWVRGLAMSVCSAAGQASILVALNQKSPTTRRCSRLWEILAGIIRFPSEFFIQVLWALPLMLTFPLRLPVALFLDLMATEMCTVGEWFLRASEALGCGLADSVEERGITTGSTPVIFIHGLNSSRALWLVGLLFLRARAKHIGPFVTLKSVLPFRIFCPLLCCIFCLSSLFLARASTVRYLSRACQHSVILCTASLL